MPPDPPTFPFPTVDLENADSAYLGRLRKAIGSNDSEGFVPEVQVPPSIQRLLSSSNKVPVDALPEGIGGDVDLSGENFIFVSASGTPLENGQALLEARDAAMNSTPNGVAQSSENMVWLILAPGIYDLDGNTLSLNGSGKWVSLMGMGNRSVRIESSVTGDFGATVRIGPQSILHNLVIRHTTDLSVVAASLNHRTTATALRIVRNATSSGTVDLTDLSLVSSVDLWAYNNQSVSVGGETSSVPTLNGGRFLGVRSFDQDGVQKNSLFTRTHLEGGVFSECVAGQSSFGAFGSANGTFIKCSAGNTSYGFSGNAPGLFRDCVAGDYSFAYGGDASGHFFDCTAGRESFGTYGNAANGEGATGKFIRCTAGIGSFGYDSVLTGYLYECSTEDGGFCGGSGKNFGIIEKSFVVIEEGLTTPLAVFDGGLYKDCLVRTRDDSITNLGRSPGTFDHCVFDGDYGYLSTLNDLSDDPRLAQRTVSCLFVRSSSNDCLNYGHESDWSRKNPYLFPEEEGYY